MNENELHKKFREYGANAREWMRKCVLLLPEIDRRAVWRRKGFGSIYEYAAKLAGMSRATVEEALRVLHKIEDKPELMRIVELKGIQAVRPIATITTNETQSFWAEKARIMAKNTLETYVKNYREEKLPRKEVQPVKLTMDLDYKIAAALEKMKGQSSWNELMTKLLAGHVPESVKAISRHIPNHIQRYAKEKFAGRCHYPNCKRPGEILHHTQRFALERVHDPSRLVYLCKEHEQLAHLGLFDNEEESTFAWKLRKRADKLDYKYYTDRLVQINRSP